MKQLEVDSTKPEELIKRCIALRREGCQDDALSLLRDALRRRRVPIETIDSAGRILRKSLTEGAAPDALKVLILGQCTTTWLMNALTAEAWGRGATVHIEGGGYDSVIQDLVALTETIDAIVLVPWHQRLLASDDRSTAQRVDDELAFLQQAWTLVEPHARLVQVGYDSMLPGPMGYHLGGRSGHVQHVRHVNQEVRHHLPEGAYFVDLEQISASIGHDAFYDARNYFWTKQPFSQHGLARLAEHVWGGLRAVTTGPKKVLVLDLDNTLWGGVVGELGPLEIELGESPQGEAFRAFQHHAKELSSRGVILAACSKNNPVDAREPFEKNPNMILSLSDFASFEASWDPKPVALERIAETLRLGLDSFVFFDDNPAEREHVRQALPDVEVVDVPADPADFLGALQRGLWFESVAQTEADTKRAEQYASEHQRREVQRVSVSLDEYLSSLEMSAVISPIDEADIPRVTQLLGKTNQFNLTTRRHSAEHVKKMIAASGALARTVRLRDRFGDYGLISVVIGEAQTDCARPTLRIDTWLMSCRAIGRTVECFVMNQLAQQAEALDYEVLLGELIPTAKNGLVADLYLRFGFEPHEDFEHSETEGLRRFQLELTQFKQLQTFVQPAP